MKAQQQFAHALRTLPLVAILRGVPTLDAVAIGTALVGEGWQLIEVPLNSPQPLASIEAMAAALPQALVGAGTVLTPMQVRDVHAAGGRLVVSPNFDAQVVAAAVRLGLVCLPGVATLSEAYAALAAGASGLKLFPAEMITPARRRAVAQDNTCPISAKLSAISIKSMTLPSCRSIWAREMTPHTRCGACPEARSTTSRWLRPCFLSVAITLLTVAAFICS